MKVGIIVQARMNSVRVPHKISISLGGMPLLWHVVNGLKNIKNSQNIVVATGPEKNNRWIEKFCLKNDINFFSFEGDENDVLSRFYQAAMKYNFDQIVRVCADNAIISADEIDHLITNHLLSGADYTTNSGQIHPDLACEIFSFSALKFSYLNAKSEYDREHVTPFIMSNPDRFTISIIQPRLKWPTIKNSFCIDEFSDIEPLSKLVDKLFDGKNPISDKKLINYYSNK